MSKYILNTQKFEPSGDINDYVETMSGTDLFYAIQNNNIILMSNKMDIISTLKLSSTYRIIGVMSRSHLEEKNYILINLIEEL